MLTSLFVLFPNAGVNQICSPLPGEIMEFDRYVSVGWLNHQLEPIGM